MRSLPSPKAWLQPSPYFLAWLLTKPFVTSVIIGAKRIEQLQDNLAAADLELTVAEIKQLDEVSTLPPGTRAGCFHSRAPAAWSQRPWRFPPAPDASSEAAILQMYYYSVD